MLKINLRTIYTILYKRSQFNYSCENPLSRMSSSLILVFHNSMRLFSSFVSIYTLPDHQWAFSDLDIQDNKDTISSPSSLNMTEIQWALFLCLVPVPFE